MIVFNEEPKCAEVCPNGALQVDEIAIDEEGNTQVRLIFNKTKCDECGDCVDACPTKTLKLDAEDSQLLKGFCVMCQKCVDICPVDVIGVPGCNVSKMCGHLSCRRYRSSWSKRTCK